MLNHVWPPRPPALGPRRPMKFENPANGYVEEVSSPFLWALLFGPFYFFAKGAWQAAIGLIGGAWIVAALTGYGAFIVWIFAAIQAGDIVKRGYLRRGWREWLPTYHKEDDDDD